MHSMSLGHYVRSFGKVPAGSDANLLFLAFQATDKPVWVTHMSTWGGDSSEFANFYLIPPEFAGNASNGRFGPQEIGGDEKNAMNIFGPIEGGTYTSTNKFPAFGYVSSKPSQKNGFLIPPNYALSMTLSAGNTTGFKVIIGGFELE